MVGMAVKITGSPEHAGFDEAAMLTLTGRFGLTDMVIKLEVAGLPVAQVALEVSTQVTRSLLANAAVV